MNIPIGIPALRLRNPVIGISGVQLAGGGGAPSYDADAVTLFAAMSSQPDSTRKQLISDTIASLKSAGIWAKLDECWFLAAHDSQAALLGWKRYKDCTAVNAPTFTTDRGYAGNGTTSYLNTGFVPSTHGVQYTLNDASFGVYSRTNANATSSADMGAQASSSSNRAILFIRNGNEAAYRVNQNAAQSGVANTDSSGLWVARRTASNAISQYHNGASFATSATASTGRPAVAMFIAAQNNNGTPSQFSTRQYAFAFVGASMSAGQQSSLFTIVESYLDSIGAGVVA